MIELASILILSVVAQWLAWKIKVPAILPLIIIGLAFGPLSTFVTPYGDKLLDGDDIFSGDFLFSFVSISVGVILFEGGLTLKLSEIRHQAGVVRNLLIFGPIITLVGGGFAAHYLLDLDYRLAFLFGALIIVSGPTVVLPILRNTRPNERINNVLKWEGILIDPLGALIAVLVYEFIQTSHFQNSDTLEVFKEFFITIASGVFVGALAAFFLRWAMKKNRLPSYLRNVVALGLVIFAFTFSELIHPEAGLMAATCMGIVLANIKVDSFNKILSFKEDVSIILISVLFILLSSRIDMVLISKLGWKSIALFGVVMFIIRPLYVWLSTMGSKFNWKEVFFMSWVGPKGIVAAAVASLFSLQLAGSESSQIDAAQAELILPLTFLMIVGTVVIQGLTAKPLAKILKVERTDPKGVLFAGANENSRFLATFLRDQKVPVMLADTSRVNIKEAQRLGFDVYEGNIVADNVFDDLDLTSIGKLMAMTSSSEINSLACKWFESEFGEDKVYRLASKKELELKELELSSSILFEGKVDYLNLAQSIRAQQKIMVEPCSDIEAYESLLKKHRNRIIPLFILDHEGEPEIITKELPNFSKGDRLAFIPMVESSVIPLTEVADIIE
jgi:NhaP-type Na+/H+ or K+/H+ antiporter